MGIATSWKPPDLVLPYDVLSILDGHADDYEAEVVRDVAIKAGYYWKCTCGWINTSDKLECQGRAIEGGKRHRKRPRKPCLP